MLIGRTRFCFRAGGSEWRRTTRSDWVVERWPAVQAINHGTKNYHWQVIRPRAAQATGDQRINSFGIGGEMEIRAGLLVQKQLVTGPIVHFGLGDQTGADVVRIVWPNGAVRAEFETKADQTILAEQRLKGSCPFLFAYNGKEMKFVKDAVPWGSAIGLRINTLGTARVEATEEWYKIGGDELVPRDGYYDLRITAELWETYYYDQLALMTVDHPAGTDIFVDERFVIPPAKLAITTVETPHKIAQAVDDNGNDVTDIVSALDEKYLDNFGRGRYQGVTSRSLRRSRSRRRCAAEWPAVVDCQRLDAPDRFLDQRGDQSGSGSSRAAVEHGSARWQGRLDCGATQPGLSRRAQEDLSVRSG